MKGLSHCSYGNVHFTNGCMACVFLCWSLWRCSPATTSGLADAGFNRQHCIEHSGMAEEAAYKGKAAALCCSQSDTAFMLYLWDMNSRLCIAQANFKAKFLISWAVLQYLRIAARTRRCWLLCNRRHLLWMMGNHHLPRESQVVTGCAHTIPIACSQPVGCKYLLHRHATKQRHTWDAQFDIHKLVPGSV